MSTSSVQSTAQIIRFPVGGRKALSDIRRQVSPVAEVEPQAVAIGDAWYHQAAIEESKLVSGH
jgi:hypothetical protein